MTSLYTDTPVGRFTRSSRSAYTHAVVWNSPRAMAYFLSTQNGGPIYKNGVHSRWAKDRGYGVTWHKSANSAMNAKKYGWDGSTSKVGVFEVRS